MPVTMMTNDDDNHTDDDDDGSNMTIMIMMMTTMTTKVFMGDSTYWHFVTVGIASVFPRTKMMMEVIMIHDSNDSDSNN